VSAFVAGALSFDEFIQATIARPTPAPASCTRLQLEARVRRPSLFKRAIWAVFDFWNQGGQP
jgi:hypothetical protein